MDLDDIVSTLKRGWLAILALTVIGAVLGYLALARTPTKYTSSAMTSISSMSKDAKIESMFGAAQAVRVNLPIYLAQASSDEVAAEAGRAAGVPTAAAKAALAVTSETDSPVFTWSYTADRPGVAQKALAAATTTFAKKITASSPVDNGGAKAIQGSVMVPASEETASRRSPVIGALALGLLGLLAGVAATLLRGGLARRLFTADEVEVELGTPVVGEAGRDSAARHEAWRYVAAYLTTRGVTGPVLLAGGAHLPLATDVEDLSALLRTSGVQDPRVLPATLLDDPQLVDLAARADAVVFCLIKHVDDVQSLRTPLRTAQRLVQGPAVAILDHRRAPGRRARQGLAQRPDGAERSAPVRGGGPSASRRG